MVRVAMKGRMTMFVREERFGSGAVLPLLQKSKCDDWNYGRFMQPDPIGYGMD